MGQLNSFISLFCQMYWAYLKVLFKYPPPKGGEGRGSSLCTGYGIKTVQITSCQHKIFCFSPRNFFAFRAFWFKFLLKPGKLQFTSSPKFAFYKSHYTSQPSLCVLSTRQTDKNPNHWVSLTLCGVASGLLK